MIKRNNKGQFVKGKNLKHGLCQGKDGTRFYRIYKHILSRCNNPNEDKRHSGRYMHRGIKCKWKTFQSFIDDMYISYQKHVKEFGESETTIDRINNNGHYCKENCRWATRKEQAINRRTTRFYTFKGETKCMNDWIKEFGFARGCVESRLRDLHWSIEKALTTPSNRK